jgi:hypothetical protein
MILPELEKLMRKWIEAFACPLPAAPGRRGLAFVAVYGVLAAGALVAARPQAAMAASSFDGVWNVDVHCTDTNRGIKGYNWQFPARVSKGHFSGVYRAGQRINTGQISGQIRPDGSASLRMTGRTGNPANNLGGVDGGLPFAYGVAARFSGASGEGHRVGGRNCALSFSKQ